MHVEHRPHEDESQPRVQPLPWVVEFRRYIGELRQAYGLSSGTSAESTDPPVSSDEKS